MEERRIQFFDSMHGSGAQYINGLMKYVKDEWKAKKGGELPDADEWKLVTCENNVPTQTNGVDCGVFTCMFADFLSMNRPLSFGQAHISQCRDRIALSIMKGVAIE
jgi:sentrin-specific protease 1